jgi:F-type H+-transporting ATPase subunit a
MSIFSPLEQFALVTLVPVNLFGYNVSITNATLFLVLSFFVSYSMFRFATYNATVSPNNWQYVAESLYNFVNDKLVGDLIQHERSREYFPFVFVLFIFILTSNELGMIPYTFTVTSHLFMTFTLGMIVFVAVNIVAFSTHGLHFFSFFLPPGCPMWIVPGLIGIELISYIFRVISISVRLFANMMSGHCLLKILAGFAWTMLSLGVLGYIGSFAILSFILAFTALEVAIAFIQAYIFALLTCLYMKDAIHLH